MKKNHWSGKHVFTVLSLLEQVTWDEKDDSTDTEDNSYSSYTLDSDSDTVNTHHTNSAGGADCMYDADAEAESEDEYADITHIP